MKITLINGLLFCLVFMWTSAATKSEPGFDVYENGSRVSIQLRRKACRNLGGRCVKRNRDCPKRLPLKFQPGRPYCSSKRHCCYPDDTDIGVVLPCGIETGATASHRIVNGNNVIPNRKYSWQVGLKYPGEYPNVRYFCGGSIINKKYILTAAHCFYDFNVDGTCQDKPNLNTILVGLGANMQSGPERLIGVSEIIQPDNYVCNNFKIDDIAVIQLAESIYKLIDTGFVHPICLPRDDSKTYVNECGIISGWGSTIGYNPGIGAQLNSPNELQDAIQLPIMSNSECGLEVGFDEITDNMICTSTEGGFAHKGKGPCKGDSGGPLTIKQNGQHGQIGIVSWSEGCASEDNPAVYTRVTKYLNWIGLKAGEYYILPLNYNKIN